MSSLELSLEQMKEKELDKTWNRFMNFVNEECCPHLYDSYEIVTNLMEEYLTIHSELNKIRTNFNNLFTNAPPDEKIRRIIEQQFLMVEKTYSEQHEKLERILNDQALRTQEPSLRILETKQPKENNFLIYQSGKRILDGINESIQNLIETSEQYPKMRAYIADLLHNLFPKV